MVFSLMAETRVLKQLTDGDRTVDQIVSYSTIDVTVAGKELNRYASTRTVGTKNVIFSYY